MKRSVISLFASKHNSRKWICDTASEFEESAFSGYCIFNKIYCVIYYKNTQLSLSGKFLFKQYIFNYSCVWLTAAGAQSLLSHADVTFHHY